MLGRRARGTSADEVHMWHPEQPAYDAACCCLWLEAALQHLSQHTGYQNQVRMAGA